MSIYLYLQCQSHNPPICSDMEVGQHLYDLPNIRKHIANRQTYADLAAQGIEISGDYFDRHAIRFVIQHPHCHIGIVDEYDCEHPIEQEDMEVTDG